MRPDQMHHLGRLMDEFKVLRLKLKVLTEFKPASGSDIPSIRVVCKAPVSERSVNTEPMELAVLTDPSDPLFQAVKDHVIAKIKAKQDEIASLGVKLDEEFTV